MQFFKNLTEIKSVTLLQPVLKLFRLPVKEGTIDALKLA